MQFASGTRLGRFAVDGLLGAGGMGEVYRATDTRLNRSVAIKIVPPEIAADPILKERLRREAQMIAALQHPHICVLYDVAELDGVDCLIMEHIEGETLAERLRRGPPPVDEVLRHAGEIVSALAAAHGVGIVHRDLKPANIMLTPSGAKLLDFGIAKRRSADGAIGEAPTADARLTAQVILGTLGYMAPEQLQGKDADARSDIFALGATLFELATAQRAFAGASETDRLAAVMAGQPDVAALERAAVPPLFKSTVLKCLAAEPERRWQAASDIADVLRWLDSDSPAASSAASRPRAGRRAGWLAVGATGGALAVLAAVQWLRPPSPEAAQSLRLAVTAPPATSFAERDITGHPQFALSPDGSRLAFVAARRGEPAELWIRSLATGAAQPLAGTDDASGPFWSPDGRFVGFFAHGKLKRVAAAGGTVQELADVSVSVEGGAWSSRDVIVFSRSTGEGLFQVPASGGALAPVTVLDPANEETGHRWPDFLPDGRRFLMFVRGAERGVYLADLDGGAKRRLLHTDANAVYAEPGRLLFEQGGTLMAQSFDLDSGTLVGEPVSMGDPIVSLGGPSYLPASAARNGMLAYWSGGPPMTRLEWIARDGRPLGAIDVPYRSDSPRLSPDATRVLFMQRRNNNLMHVWRADLDTGLLSQLTFGADGGRFGVWSPDGESFVFAGPGGSGVLWQKSASGAGPEMPILDAGRRYALFPEDWSADGRWLLYVETTGGWDIMAYDTETRTPQPMLVSPANEIHARISPTGSWLAYTSNESGNYEVYVQSFPDGSGKWRVSTNGGSQPTWRGDGRELYYLATDGQLVAVPIGPGPTFEAGAPTALFATRLPPVLAPFRHDYAPAPDGQRFLLNNLAIDREPTAITIVSGWHAAVDARAK